MGATVHGLLHLPHELAQPGKMGDILKTLLLKRGHYVALVSRMEDSLAEEPMVNETGRDRHRFCREWFKRWTKQCVNMPRRCEIPPPQIESYRSLWLLHFVFVGTVG